MELKKFIDIVYQNLTPILAGITIISFIMNVIQYKTKKNLRFILDGMLQNCVRIIRSNEKKEKSNSEFVNLIYIMRDHTVSGLRALGGYCSYGSYDYINSRGKVFIFLKNTFYLIKKVKEKWPEIRSSKKTVQLNKLSKENNS